MGYRCFDKANCSACPEQIVRNKVDADADIVLIVFFSEFFENV